MSNNDSIQDEIRLQQQRLKGQPLQKKWEYYWNYYKIPAVVILLAACIMGSLLHSMLTRKETVLSVACINAFPNIEDSLFMEGFNQYLELNPKKQVTFLDSSYYINEDLASPYTASNRQRFSTMVMVQHLDVVLADEYYFTFYAGQGFFQDLTPLLTAKQLKHFEQDLFYQDLPDDEKEEPVPVGINITNTPKIVETSCYPNVTAYYGIAAGSKYTDNAVSFLAYLEASPKSNNLHTD